MNKKVLIICYSDHNKEPRLLMQCSALKDQFNITTAGFSPVSDSSISFIKLSGLVKKALFTFHLKFPKLIRLPFSAINKFVTKLSGNSVNFYAADYNKLSNYNFDLIICHHPSSLEIAHKLKKNMVVNLFLMHTKYILSNLKRIKNGWIKILVLLMVF